MKKWIIWALIAALSAGNVLPILASYDADEAWDEIEIINDLDPDYIEGSDKASSSNVKKASSSNADALDIDIFTDIPIIGSSAFTDWFFSHSEREELWSWVFELLYAVEGEDYNLFMPGVMNMRSGLTKPCKTSSV